MKSKKGWTAVAILLGLGLVALITIICVRKSNPQYNYARINDAFWISGWVEDDTHYVDVKSQIYRSNLRRTAWFINLYNDELAEKGRPLEDALSLDEVIDFYSSEYDENKEPRINNLPVKIEDYLDWYYGLFRKGPRLDEDKASEESKISIVMFALGVYSERKNTQQTADVVIDNPVDFYLGIYVYNTRNPSEMITEDEILLAMAGGPKESLIRFGEWFLDPATAASAFIEDFYYQLVDEYCASYSNIHPDAPKVHDMDLNEIRQLVECMEKKEE